MTNTSSHNTGWVPIFGQFKTSPEEITFCGRIKEVPGPDRNMLVADQKPPAAFHHDVKLVACVRHLRILTLRTVQLRVELRMPENLDEPLLTCRG